MTVQTLLGDPAPPLSGPMVPHRRCEGLEGGGKAGGARPGLTTPVSPCSALESIQSVRAAQAPHWTSLQQQGRCGLGRVVGLCPGLSRMAVTLNDPLDSAPVLSPSTRSPEERPSPLLSEGPESKTAAAQAMAAAPSALLDGLPTVRTAVALTSLDTAPVLPPDIPHQEGSALEEETQSWVRWAEWAWADG